MSVSGVSNEAQTYESMNTVKTKNGNSKNEAAQKTAEEKAAVYDKEEAVENKQKTYKRDDKTVEKLLAESEKRAQSLRDLVQKMLRKQGETYTEATDIYALLREGKVKVDPETSAQAKKDIAEDGYWGVNQTSDRLVSFAKALTGGDPSKADEMIEAVKKGFEEATKAWGGELPEISKRTLEAAVQKLESWRDGKEDSSAMSKKAADEFAGQAVTNSLV